MLTWQLKHFKELSGTELYNLMRVRQEVFIVEQNCPYLDADGKDIYCQHLIGYVDGEIAAYARIVPPHVSYNEPSIGRVITTVKYRTGGYGKLLMQKAITETINTYGAVDIRIGAQLYLKKFYESFGFLQQGDVYDEDGIDHIIMLRRP
ncbi:MAG: GNAT family N-acetyltransferase [Bacteroidetes bacterium]|nr:GNAT family N-acetyltransferase [Bacteroidota bacterium]